jgi:hypothetical protein
VAAASFLRRQVLALKVLDEGEDGGLFGILIAYNGWYFDRADLLDRGQPAMASHEFVTIPEAAHDDGLQ